MHCLISVVVDKWSAIFREHQALKRRIIDATDVTNLARPPVFQAARGCLLVVDWDRRQVLAGLELPKPTGFLLDGDLLHVALWDRDAVWTLRGGETASHRGHRWLNHPHSISRGEQGLLVASAGSDLLAEIDEAGELLWSFFLFEHGYGRPPYRLGARFDRAQNYNGRYLPAALSSHPNSALYDERGAVLATLFSTGELVRIDRGQSTVDVVLSGLRRPHAIRRRPGGYMLCDTEAASIVLLDRQLHCEGRIPVQSPWVQDAVFADDRLLFVSDRKIIMSPMAEASADGGGDNCVVEQGASGPRQRLNFGSEHRIYMVEPISSPAAEALAHAWQPSGMDVSWLRWETP
jgi:hypothetical protein